MEMDEGFYLHTTGASLDSFHDPYARHLASRRPPLCCRPDWSLMQAIRTLAERRVHRLWSVDHNGVPTACVSLSDVISAALGC